MCPSAGKLGRRCPPALTSWVEQVAGSALFEVREFVAPEYADFRGRLAGEDGFEGGLMVQEDLDFFGVPFRVEFAEEGGEVEARVQGTEGVGAGEFEADAGAGLAGEDAGVRGEAGGGKANAGEFQGVEAVRERFAVETWGAEMTERGGGAAADAELGEFKQADAGVEEGGLEAAHVRGRVDPWQAGVVDSAFAIPVRDGNDGEIEVELAFVAEEPGEFSDRHAVLDGDGMEGGETGFIELDRAIDERAADGIDAIEDDEGQAMFGGCLHRQAHGGDVGVKPASDVLDVEDEGVESGQIFGLRFAGWAVEAVDRKAGPVVAAIGNFGLVELSADAVFRAEKGLEVHVTRRVKEIDGGPAVAGEAGMICDEAGTPAAEWGEPIALEDVDAVQDGGWCLGKRRWNTGGEWGGSLRGQGGDGVPKLSDVAATGMVPVREEDDEGLLCGIDPDGGAGPAGVAEGGARGEVITTRHRGEAGVDVPAETSLALDRVACGVGDHPGHGFRLEEADAVEFAPGQHHAGEAGDIGRGGKNAGAAADASQTAGSGIVNRSAGCGFGAGQFGGRDAGEPGGWRTVAGFPHAEWCPNLAAGESVQGFARDAMDDFRQENEIEVAVEDAGARFRDGFTAHDPRQDVVSVCR